MTVEAYLTKRDKKASSLIKYLLLELEEGTIYYRTHEEYLQGLVNLVNLKRKRQGYEPLEWPKIYDYVYMPHM